MNGAKMALSTPMKMNLLLRLACQHWPSLPGRLQRDAADSPLHKVFPLALPHKLLSHLSSAVEKISHEAEPDIPFESFGQGIGAEAQVTPFLLADVGR